MELSCTYLICCTPRVGSTLLARGLESTGVAGNPREYFGAGARGELENPFDWRTDDAHRIAIENQDLASHHEFLNSIKIKGTTRNGVFGAKIHWFQIENLSSRLAAVFGEKPLHNLVQQWIPGCRLIWLRRKDKIAQAVSWYRAIETRQFAREAGAPMGANSAEIPEFDYERIKMYLSVIKSGENGWGNFFSAGGYEPLVLEYEKFTGSYHETIVTMLKYLRIQETPASLGAPALEKMSDAISKEWVTRFLRIKEQRTRGV